MSKIDITRKKVDYPSGRRKEVFFLYSPHLVNTVIGTCVHLGGRKNLIHLRNKINKYLETNE